MSLERNLVEGSIAVDADVRDRDAVLRGIARLALRNPIASSLDEEALYAALRQREELGSTGLGHGLAIPHCAVDELDDFVVGLLVASEPVEFGSVDGKPSDLFVFIVGPRRERNRHIRLLSAISKAAMQESLVSRVRSAEDPGTVRSLVLSTVAYDEESSGSERVLFQIVVQRNECFEELLNLLSSVVPGSISVIETRNAGAYLFKMPLFAAFWSENRTQEVRIVLAVVDKRMTNNLIRQIHDVTGDPDRLPGVLVTVQDLAYSAGSLSF